MRRGSVMFIVMWAISAAALVLSALQLFGYRHAMLGREAVARVQARWAARGGIEYSIAVMADHTFEPVPDAAFAMVDDLDTVSAGDVEAGGFVAASWDIRHSDADGGRWIGPMDEHSKININVAATETAFLNEVDHMTVDVIDALLDWMDEDDQPRLFGVETDYYQGLSMPYEPRNGPMRSPAEIELVGGVWPRYMRGEDWNMNNRLDPNENDGDGTWPPDEPDGLLDAAWFGLYTTYSRGGGFAASGLPRIDPTDTNPAEVAERLGIEDVQAESILAFLTGANNRPEQLLTRYVEQTLTAAPGRGDSQQQAGEMPLTKEVIRLVFDEFAVNSTADRLGGRVNLNTASEKVLRQLLLNREHLADEIIFLRNRPQGITSIVDLLDIRAFQEDTETLEYLARVTDVRSNVFSITSRGRAWSTGTEVEIVAVVDRSTVPIRILEYREQ